jgi:hypothetical protein
VWFDPTPALPVRSWEGGSRDNPEFETMNTEHANKAEAESLVAALMANGYEITRYLDENGWWTAPKEPKKIVEIILEADEANIETVSPSGKKNELFLVLGNEPGVLVCDYLAGDFILDAILEAENEKFTR